MRSFLLAVSIIFTGVIAANGQGRYVHLAAQYSSSRIYHEAIILPGEVKADVLISFRVPNDRLVFMRDRQPEAGREFFASFELTVQIRKGRETIESRTVQADHFAGSFDETHDRSRDYEGMVTFTLDPGEYTYTLRLKDVNADREGRSVPRQFKVPSSGEAFPPFLVEQHSRRQGGLALRPANLGGDAPYGRPFILSVPVMIGANISADDVQITYSIGPSEDAPGRQSSQAASQTLDGVIDGRDLIGFETVEVTAGGNGSLLFTTPGGHSNRFVATIPVEGEILPDGKYAVEITVTARDRRSSSEVDFSTHWRNMPISLHDVDVAISNLSFIEDRSVIRNLSRGNKQQRKQAFLEYWRQKDPTPESEFNQLMAEYYRRIDHAAFAFRTGSEPVPDGLRTDRAQIYILHGEPESIERELPGRGAGVRETWTYRDGRTFVFEAASSLDRFRLVQS